MSSSSRFDGVGAAHLFNFLHCVFSICFPFDLFVCLFLLFVCVRPVSSTPNGANVSDCSPFSLTLI